MQQPAHTTATTHAPHKGAGFPPFKTETFPGQIFWLAITFVFLFVVLWRVAGPRIGGAIAMRKDKIASDLGAAEAHRKEADAASAAYDTALAAARARSRAMDDENRKRINDEIERAKAKAEAEAHDAMAKADAGIAASRSEAKGHVLQAAQDAAAQIVARLTGDKVSPEEAAAAVRAVAGS
ncbi:MAG: F0F1 ATP synthase subunit B' [Proteobacteria bacterium]|nr:F0F1 ATP synthase subunit B' [Pseudomonadota bacterium]